MMTILTETQKKIRFYFLMSKHKEIIQIASITCLALLVFTYQLARESLWLDEMYTYFASNTWSNLVATIGWKEKNMWLYHISMYFWKFLGPGEFVMRLLSVVFATAGAIYMYLLGKQLGGIRLGFIAAILLILNTFYVYYAQEARGYSLFTTLFIISSYYLLRTVENNTIKNRILYIFFTGISIYSQIFALIFIGLQALFLFCNLFKKKKGILLFIQIYSGVVLFIIPLVLAYILANTSTVVIRTQNVLNWVNPVTLKSVFDQYYMYSSESISLFLLYFVLILFLFWYVIKVSKKQLPEVVYFAIMAFIPVIFIYLFSLYVKPLFVPRYLVFTLPPFIMLVAMGLNNVKNRYILAALLLIIVVFNVKSLKGLYYNYSKEQWREAVSYLYENKKANEKVIVFPYYLRMPFNYYAEDNTKYNPSLVVMPYPNDIRDYSAATVKTNAQVLQNQVDKAPGVWVITRKDNRPAPRTVQKKEMDKVLKQEFENCKVTTTFTSIEIDYCWDQKE